MCREAVPSNEIHTSHGMSKRSRIKREDRLWNHINDLMLTSKIELRNTMIKGVQ
jgi:hypothetical protein